MQVTAWGALLALFLGQAASVFIPTSDVVDVARDIARLQGFPVANRRLMYVDLLAPPNAKAPLPGFISTGVFNNDHMVLQISINERTGQVVDPTRCLLFEYPSVLRFGVETRRATGAKAMTEAELSDTCGCKLRVVRTSQPSRNP
jgi:hypothetical protein